VSASVEDWDVIIVGGGPVGISTANLLGVYGVRTLVVERAEEILDYPRAVGLDDEALRMLQTADLAEPLLADMISNVPLRMFTADGRSFADILPTTTEFGWPRRNIFSQPLSEVTLREGLERFGCVELLVGHEATDFEQDDSGVRLTIADPAGIETMVRARYLVGADGGRSTVRDRFVEIPMEGVTHPRKWVVIECDDDPLDAPYTALHCDPERPYVCARLPYGLRRWEFMLFPGEDEEEMLRPERVQELLTPHVPDPSRLNIIRARVYTHHSRVARSFRAGRVFLAGDAAHLTPPWIGQGLNAGFRDVANLAWKLAGVIHGQLAPAALDTYYAERHQHAKAMIDLADQVGAVMAVRNRQLAWLRDRVLLGMKRIPPVRDYVLQFRFKPMPSYGADGFVADGTVGAQAGKMIIQPDIEMPDGSRCKLDEACGQWFALIGWKTDPMAHLPSELREQWCALGATSLMAVRARSSRSPHLPITTDTDTVVVQDIENKLSFWFERTGCNVAILRPDRYVAALTPALEIASASRSLFDRYGERQSAPTA